MIAAAKNRNKWGFVCGRVSALEGRLMPYDFFVALAGIERTGELLHRLQETSLREAVVPGAAAWEDWSTVIDTYLYDQVLDLRRNCPEPAVANLFLLSQDYLNLKRAVLRQTGYPYAAGILPPDRLAEAAGGSHNLLPQPMRTALAALSGGAAENGAFLLDVLLDGAYLRHMIELSSRLDARIVGECMDLLVLYRAVITIWRAVRAGHGLRDYRQHFLPLGKHDGVIGGLLASPDIKTWRPLLPGIIGDLFEQAQQAHGEDQVSHFELLAVNAITHAARAAKLQSIGPERVCGFLWGLWIEAYNFKVVIRGRLNGLDPTMLKPRLRACYV